jgi:putative tricarboxylic transport membrane protein
MRKDLISSLILLGIAVAYYAASTDIQDSSLSDEVGPRGLPTVLAMLLVAIALVIGARALLAPLAQAETERDASAKWYRSAGLLAIAALYIPLAEYLGYWLGLFLILLGVPLYEGVKLSWRPFVIAALGATFFFVLFDLVLGVRQPTGVLF